MERIHVVLVVLTVLAAVHGVRVRSARGDVIIRSVPRQGSLPAWARSLSITDSEGAVIVSAPSIDAPVAGQAAPNASFPILDVRPGRGCQRLWVRIGPEAWVCGDRGELSSSPPAIAHTNETYREQVLPWAYAFTVADRTRVYRSLTAALAQSDDPESYEYWEANWGLAIESELIIGNERIFRTHSGRYLRRRQFYRASPTEFAGGTYRELVGDEPSVPFGWVAEDRTLVYSQPAEQGPAETLPRLSRVRVYALHGTGSRAFARIGPNRWVRADKIRWVSPAPPPEEVNIATRERWIDVDLTSQTLIAYEGTEPVYATMVSTGGERFPTLPGVFRIWGKYLYRTMDNTEASRLRSHYRFEDVPWVQFFDGDRGLHSVYWHDHFGIPRSHGCVNLSPRDARFLFAFTSHSLPPGWTFRVIPAGQGTLVRVRGRYEGSGGSDG